MGEAFGALFGPHHGKSGVGMMTNLHMQCAAPNTGYLEYMYDPGLLERGRLSRRGLRRPVSRSTKSGYVHAPDAARARDRLGPQVLPEVRAAVWIGSMPPLAHPGGGPA